MSAPIDPSRPNDAQTPASSRLAVADVTMTLPDDPQNVEDSSRSSSAVTASTQLPCPSLTSTSHGTPTLG
ncbi:MAG: hypothetical protein ACRDUX_39115 [Mycobacterium sp.]